MKFLENFIIVDDDKFNNKACRINLEKAFPDAVVHDFIDPMKGLDHVRSVYSKPDCEDRAILLLDILMPDMDAWDFLEEFDKMDELTKDRIRIYILSSSVDKSDMARAQSNKYVEYYLIKPLTKESIRLIVHVLHKRIGLVSK